jgi:signal transduction histidine kinase
MKLLAKTNLNYILFSLLAFIIGGLIFYALISADIYEDADESLGDKKNQIENYLKKKDTLPDLNTAFDSLTFITVVYNTHPDQFKDTSFFSKEENEDMEYRALIFTETFHNKIYQFIITKSQIESDDIIQVIIVAMFLVFLILLAVLIAFNYFLSKKIWKPFYKTMKSLEGFNLQNNKKPELGESTIAEFKKLNEVLNAMTEKMLKDFSVQKEFSENASHEMQTPLAIIRSKLELLVQSENFTENQAQLIQDIYDTINRLSRINQALLLITKIENRQFPVNEYLDLTMVIQKHMRNFEELIEEKNIETKISLQSTFRIRMNPLLADTLITNLISNAIKHNIPDGKFFITQTGNSILFENTGPPLNFNSDFLFDRFRKDRQNPDSLGLGLSIVKKITDSSNMQIEYRYENEMHIFQLIFRQQISFRMTY